MSVTTLAILGVAVAIVIALLLARPVKEAGTRDVRRRFGSEFDRVTARHGGNSKAAGRELNRRLRRFRGLRVKSLSVQEREQYAAQWDGLQEQFIDCPGAVAAKANQLLSHLATGRGFPAESRDLQFEALSVHHPEQVEGGRRLHEAAQQAAAGTADAETMRSAMVAGRALFDVLVKERPQDHTALAPARTAPGGRDRSQRTRPTPT
ncbi:hypothetical protein [Streptomyces sp. NPDC058280]|uniref:hypothetical protein n=1 Tax=Streptomyces sp. NPDC058280 TaxID=3346419 RepID=UPI0036E9F60A